MSTQHLEMKPQAMPQRIACARIACARIAIGFCACGNSYVRRDVRWGPAARMT